MLGGTIRAGGSARLELEKWCKQYEVRVPTRGLMPETERFITMFRSLPLRNIPGQHWLWLFREPRDLTPGRSRYAQICGYYGIFAKKIKKKKMSLLRDISEIRTEIIPEIAPRLTFEQVREERQNRERQQTQAASFWANTQQQPYNTRIFQWSSPSTSWATFSGETMSVPETPTQAAPQGAPPQEDNEF
jgi:hypothetical protein